MSVEDLKAYGKLCTANKEVMAAAKEAGLDNIDGQIEVASKNGLTFTQADLDALSKEVGAGSSELSEDDLENVAGGFVTALAAAVVGAAAGVVSAGSAVTSTTQGSGW
ncbi:MAG: class IIb bacteriocin, lactobin A/cerein 7B family [Phycisphaeraceae bacterium]|nr:class IIb bacteriocin, lactobin A/cerein 7B family [Phycisphaeraceae bacterium]